MASWSKRDAKNLGLDGLKLEVLGRGRVRKAPQVFEAGAAKCFTRQKISDPAPLDPEPYFDDSWETEKPSVAVRCGEKDRHRKQAMKGCAAKLRRAGDFAEKHAAEICDLVGRADEIFVQFSWRQHKEMTISAFAKAMECKYSKLA
jgi:hypothetical protein